MFSYISPEQRVPADHPLRIVHDMTDRALRGLSVEFARLYSPLGRPSIAPEKLLRALLLQVFFSVRSERMLMEQVDYNPLFRWFVGLNMDEPVWDTTVFKNRQQLLDGDIAQEFLAQVVEQAREQGLLSSEHFTVDGTLLEAWASYLCHVLMEHRNGFPVGARATTASPQGEWEAAVDMSATVNGSKRRITLAADMAYDEANLLRELRNLLVTPRVQKRESENRRSHLDGRTTHHPGYQISIQKRKRIEHIFGWLKTVALMRKVRHRGGNRTIRSSLAVDRYRVHRGLRAPWLIPRCPASRHAAPSQLLSFKNRCSIAWRRVLRLDSSLGASPFGRLFTARSSRRVC